MYQGTIVNLHLERGYGFIESTGQPDTFFHCKQLDESLPFDETLEQRRVRFDIQSSPKGPRAVNVQARD